MIARNCHLLNIYFKCVDLLNVISTTKKETEAQRGATTGLSHTARKEVSPGMFTV